MEVTWTDVLQTISVVVACITAAYGIDSWRRESLGKRKMELAEDILSMFYRTRQAFMTMRNIFGNESEGKSQEDAGPAAVQVERAKRFEDLWSEMSAKSYRFQAYFGDDAAKPFYAIGGLMSKYRRAPHRIKWLGEQEALAEARGDEENADKWRLKAEEQENIIYATGGDDDVFEKELEEAIAEIEKLCKPVLTDKTDDKFQRWSDRILGFLIALLGVYFIAAFK